MADHWCSFRVASTTSGNCQLPAVLQLPQLQLRQPVATLEICQNNA